MNAHRAFEARDDEAIVALFARLHAGDPSIDATDVDRWRAYRALAPFREGRGFLVVEDEGRIVAVSTLGEVTDGRTREKVWRVRIFVDAPHRKKGIARSLLAARVRDAAARGIDALESFVAGAWTDGRAFAEKNGFSVFVHDLFLTRDASAPFAVPTPPDVHIRPYAGPSDDAAWVAISNVTLSRDAGHVDADVAAMAAFTRMPGFALFVAERDSRPVGHCHIERRGAVGYVQALAVLGAHEGCGIGAALLSRGIAALAAGGAHRIELCTEKDNERAQRLYARAGFVLDRDAFTYRKKMAGV